MARISCSLMMLLARATQAELVAVIDYLKTENRILLAKMPKRLDVTIVEKRELVRRGNRLAKEIQDLVTIVSPRTLARWVNGEMQQPAGKRKAPSKVGCPCKPEETGELVVQMAKDSG